jgi:hypothetical protein
MVPRPLSSAVRLENEGQACNGVRPYFSADIIKNL